MASAWGNNRSTTRSRFRDGVQNVRFVLITVAASRVDICRGHDVKPEMALWYAVWFADRGISDELFFSEQALF